MTWQAYAEVLAFVTATWPGRQRLVLDSHVSGCSQGFRPADLL